MKFLSACLFASLFLCPTALRAEFRSWTNSDGKNVDAELVKVTGETVTFRLRSGGSTNYALSKLSEADRDYIAKNPPGAASSQPAAAAKDAGTTAAPTVDANRKAKWQTKMAKAQDEAKKTGLPILVLFTGTSWCPYCIKLEAAVFSKKEFSTFADKNLVLLKLEFGPGGSTNDKAEKKLQSEYGVKGFPTYFLTDATGTKLAQGGYNDGITPESFAAWVTGAAKPK
ncbi:MAG: thioredoxin family protein [Verrucomicrobiota bacterium]